MILSKRLIKIANNNLYKLSHIKHIKLINNINVFNNKKIVKKDLR